MGECPIRKPVGFYKHILITFIIISAVISVITACDSSITLSRDTLQQFQIDSSDGNQGTVLRLVTPDGKERIEIFYSQFSDGTKILESVVYEKQLDTWKQVKLGQSPYQPNDPVRVCSNDQFGVFEIVDPNIVKVEHETKNNKLELSIIKVSSRRFVAIKQTPGNKEYFQVRGNGKGGEVLWQLFPEGYWNQ